MIQPLLTTQLANDLAEYDPPNSSRKVGLFLSVDDLEVLEKLCLIFRSSQANIIRNSLLTMAHQLPTSIKDAMTNSDQ